MLEPVTSRLKTSLRFGVAVDGSVVSEKAVRTGASMVNKTRQDKLFLLHISDQKKTYLSPTYKPQHMQRTCMGLLEDLRVTGEWYCKEKNTELGTMGTLAALVKELELDFLIIGSFGRKGEEEKINVLGTVSDGVLRSVHANVVIVKSTSTVTVDTPKTYVVATDNSPASRLAFENVLAIMSPRDEVLVLYASSVVSKTTILLEYEDAIHAAGRKGRTVFLSVPLQDTVTTITQTALALGADFLVAGVNGYGERPLGSVSSGLAITSRCSSITIKRAVEDRHMVRSKSFSDSSAHGPVTTAAAEGVPPGPQGESGSRHTGSAGTGPQS